jgi:hypothetical protein
LLLSQARSFPPYIEWEKGLDLFLFGEIQKTTAARNTTALTKAGRKQLEVETKRGDRISGAIPQALEAS